MCAPLAAGSRPRPSGPVRLSGSADIHLIHMDAQENRSIIIKNNALLTILELFKTLYFTVHNSTSFTEELLQFFPLYVLHLESYNVHLRTILEDETQMLGDLADW